MLFWPILGRFWCSVVTLVALSSNLDNLEKKKKKRKKKCITKLLVFSKSIINKKCYPLSFPILGLCDSTRALQSNPFQISVEQPERDTQTNGRTNERKSSCQILDFLKCYFIQICGYLSAKRYRVYRQGLLYGLSVYVVTKCNKDFYSSFSTFLVFLMLVPCEAVGS